MGEAAASGGALPEQVQAKLIELLAGELRGAWDEAVKAGVPASRLAQVVQERRRVVERSGIEHVQPHPRPDLWLPAGATVREYGAMANLGDGSGTPRYISGATIRPFVGRATERERLLAALDAARAHRPAVVLLEGEPGVGKSRLVQEYCAAARSRGARVLVGACVPLGDDRLSGSGFPYAPLTDALRLFVREHGEEAAALAGSAWTELQGLVKDFTDVETPDGGGRAAVGVGSQVQVFGAVMRLLDHLGGQAPVLVVFEDLHWADPSTLSLVSYLTRAKTDQRMVLLCSLRSRLHSGHPVRGLFTEQDFLRRTERLRLHPFTEAELRLFLGAGGVVDRDVIHRNFVLSGGNAFFAEELQDSLSRSGDEHPALPESLQALMNSRIAAVGDDAQRVLSVAAAAGRQVSEPLLVAVSRLDDDALASALRSCLDGDLLVADRDTDSYHFRHALLGEAAYNRLAGFERRKLHLAMAEAITADPTLSLDESNAAVELAHHWFAAGRKPESLAAAVRAGAANARIRAFREAEMQYKRALQLWAEVPDAVRVAGMRRDEVLTALADTARWAGHVGQAVEHTLTAIDETDPSQDPHRAAELRERLGSYQWEAGENAASADAYRTALDLLDGRPTDALKARILAALATVTVREGSYREGLKQARHAAQQAERIGARAEVGRALSTIGVASAMLGETKNGIDVLRHALRIAQDTGNLEDLLRTHANLEVAFEQAGALNEAVEAALSGIEDARRHGLTETRHGGILANNASVALFQLGRWDEALMLLDEALLVGPAVRESRYLRLTKAEIEVVRGRFTDAEALLQPLRGQPHTDPRFLETLYACEAGLALGRGDLNAAQKAAHDGITAVQGRENQLAKLRLYAIALRATADARPTAGDRREVERRAGKLLRMVGNEASGRDDEAQVLHRQCAAEARRACGTDDPDLWQMVAEGWEALKRPYPAAYARWQEAKAAHAARDPNRAARAATQARETADRLGAEPLCDALATLQAAIDGAPAPADALTDREVEVLLAVATGATYRETGEMLHMAENTVAVHVKNARAKLGIVGRKATIAWVRENL